MRVYIHTDIEGVAGWCFYANVESQSPANLAHTQRMNRLLTNEVVAACHAALDSGADEVWVNDAHGPAYSIDFELLPRRCQIIHGRPGHFDHWLACMSADVDAMICVGQHAMAAAPHAVCPHSIWFVNDGITLSETTMAAAMAGSLGVPTVFVSGDDKICGECTEKIPDIEAVPVKQGISAQNARSLCPDDACDAIHQGVKRAMQRRADIPPYVIDGPFRINLADRDPSKPLLDEPACGDDLIDTAHAAMSALGAQYGQQPIDDRSWRYPQ